MQPEIKNSNAGAGFDEERMSVANAGTEYVQRRLVELTETDPQFRAAMPDPAVNEAKLDPALGLAQIVELIMTRYADRPALGQRAVEAARDAVSGRSVRRLLDRYDTVSYGEVWSRAQALGTFWYRDSARSLLASDMICIMGFAGVDFSIVDFAAIHNGAVSVPIQTNAVLSTLQGIVNEIEPAWLAASIENLETAVELVLTAHRPKGLLLFDYKPEVDDEREAYETACRHLSAAGLDDFIVTLDDAIGAGNELESAPLFVDPAGSDRKLCTIYYTSGSTGLPKGVMYPEYLLKPTWRMMATIPFLYMHYMPMNHAMGRSGVFTALNTGGTCYFAAKSDLSTLFEDIRLVRPTFLGVVTRICEMVYQQFQVEFERRLPNAEDPQALRRELILDTRNRILGGRLLSCNFGSAPIAPELRAFMEECLGFEMDEYFGITEVSAVLRASKILKPPVIDYKLVDVPELGYFTTDKPHPRGEMLILTNNVMLGYYKRPEATAAAFDEEGYYRTGDIMEEIAPETLIYVDRRNNVQKLAQGEFVAISRLEGLFNNGHPVIRQSFIHGTSTRSFLLGVFVPSLEALAERGIDPADDSAVKAAIREAIQSVARQENLQSYEVPRDFIVEHEPFSAENGLLAGVGKYARPNLKDRYVPRLEELYDAIANAQSDELSRLRREGRDAPLVETVGRVIQAVLGIEQLAADQSASFAELGGDSLSALSCSMLLEDIYGIEVPSSVINSPAGSLGQLARFIERALAGDAPGRASFASVHGAGATEIRASDLTLERFISEEELEAAQMAAPPAEEIRTVLVTGATGYLGRFLCLEWLERMAKVGGKVICLVRARDADEARKRLDAAFDSGDLELKRHFADLASDHLEVLAGDLSEPDMGLPHSHWSRLAQDVDVIVHPAAMVNHVLPYAQMFGPQVIGTAELIRLAIANRLKPIHNVSTEVVAMLPEGGSIDEDADVRLATPVRKLNPEVYADGYAHSKWAGEVLLREAHDLLGLPVVVFRSDMIMAHRKYAGQFNQSDMLTRLLLSILMVGVAPKSFYEDGPGKPHFDGLPVDFLAATMASIGSEDRIGYRTFHAINPHRDGISLDTFIDWLVEAGCSIARISEYGEWLRRFETSLRALPEVARSLSSLPLISQLEKPLTREEGSVISADRYVAAVSRLHPNGEATIPNISREMLAKYAGDLSVMA